MWGCYGQPFCNCKHLYMHCITIKSLIVNKQCLNMHSINNTVIQLQWLPLVTVSIKPHSYHCVPYVTHDNP